MKSVWLLLLSLTFCAFPLRAGTLAQFRTVLGDIEVELYDQDKPVTVQNFIRYVQNGRYRDMFIHRCDPAFVIQGGGFFVTNRLAANPSIDAIPTYGRIVNEFGVGRRFSNTYGTLAMAKVAGDTNSASSQWYFNLKDNAFLDAPDANNLFTVFGRVVAGTNVLNAFKTFKYTGPTNLIVNIGAPLNELPVLTTNVTLNDLVYVDVSLLSVQVQSNGSGGREISWNSLSNRLHHVEFTTHLPPAWQLLLSTNGTGHTLSTTDTDGANAVRFYRVRVDY
ncbi:MAG TPA: peptidylprolyl isomerase [Verrucomicrobiae bacterium]|nr:peptidylprolyl isomerase [Verrucomicrobiae bacterium]